MAKMIDIVSGNEDFFRGMTQPPVGPPLGETGRSDVGDNYLGNARIAPLIFCVRTHDPHWCTRRVEISLGKLLRRNLPTLWTPLSAEPPEPPDPPWTADGGSVFRSFRKVVDWTRGGHLDAVHVAVWARTSRHVHRETNTNNNDAARARFRGALDDAWDHSGLPVATVAQLWDGRSESLVRHRRYFAVAISLVTRVILGTMYARSSRGTRDSMHAQLWIDNHLDLAEFLLMGGTDGKMPFGAMSDQYIRRSGAWLLLYPDGHRHVHAGALMDTVGVSWAGNTWRDHSTNEKNPLDRYLTGLWNKLQHHKCLIRRFDKMLIKYCRKSPHMISLVKDIVHVVLLGNYPHARERPGFLARIRLRRHMLQHFRAEPDDFYAWIKDNKDTLYYILREYHHYSTQRQPGLEEALHQSQLRKEHLQALAACCDQVRKTISPILSQWGPVPTETLLTEMYAKARELYVVHHKAQQRTYAKLAHGRFDEILYKQIRKWWPKADKIALIEQYGESLPIVPKPADPHRALSSNWTVAMYEQFQEASRKRARRPLPLPRADIGVESIRLDNVGDPDVCGHTDRMGQEAFVRHHASEWTVSADIHATVGQLLGPQTERLVLDVIAHQKEGVGPYYDVWWLRLIGLSWKAYIWLLRMFHRYHTENIPDNRMQRMMDRLFGMCPRDFALVYYYLWSKVSDSRVPEVLPAIYLGDRIATHQLEACRLREGLMPWESTDLDVVGSKYYCGCGQWSEVIVEQGKSDERDIHAIGLTRATFDCLSKNVVCIRRRPQCYETLRKVMMVGQAVELGKRWYTLCAKCGILTHWRQDHYSELGPDCGCHSSEIIDRVIDTMAPKALSMTTLLPMMRYDCGGLLYGRVDPDVGIHCAYCHTALDIVSRQYKLMWVLVTWKSTCYLAKAHRAHSKPPFSASSANGVVDPGKNGTDGARGPRISGGIPPATLAHRQALEVLSGDIDTRSCLDFSDTESLVLNYLHSRFGTHIYDTDQRDSSRLVHPDRMHPDAVQPGLRLLFFCRSDYLYASGGRDFMGVPMLEDIWRSIRYHRNQRKNMQMAQRHKTAFRRPAMAQSGSNSTRYRNVQWKRRKGQRPRKIPDPLSGNSGKSAAPPKPRRRKRRAPRVAPTPPVFTMKLMTEETDATCALASIPTEDVKLKRKRNAGTTTTKRKKAGKRASLRATLSRMGR